MTLKDYLSQCVLLDSAINCKLEQLEELKRKELQSKSFLQSFSGGGSQSKVEQTVVKICMLEQEINDDIDKYVDLKREIGGLIGSLSDITLKTLMEKHYLCGKKWELIAEEMFISLRNVMYLHKKAMATLEEKYSGSGIA